MPSFDGRSESGSGTPWCPQGSAAWERRRLPDKTFDIVLAESLDRISRDQEDAASFYKRARYHGIEIHTSIQGRITAMHVGMSATMSALYLEAVAATTHRGLSARVEKGQSAGGWSYGYAVATDDKGAPIKGKLAIVPEEEAIVRRIFQEYANGRSPLHIAAALNADGIPAPRHKAKGNAGSGHWKQNTINGNRQRGTGILNNELYIGQRVWNRLEFRKDPDTQKRVSIPRPESEWIRHEDTDLAIVPRELWDAVKARQAGQAPRRLKHWTGDRNQLSGSQALRRRKYLLSGLLECGICGGKMTVAGTGGRKRYYCANHKEKSAAVCPGMPGLLQADAEGLVMEGYRQHLMTAEAYAAFQEQFQRQFEAQLREREADQKIRAAQIAKAERGRANLLKAVELGNLHASIFDQLTQVERELEHLRAELEAGRPRPVSLPDNLPELYRARVAELVALVNAEEISGRWADELRLLIERIVVRHDARQGHTIEIFGNLAEMLAAAYPDLGDMYRSEARSLKLVAGAGFEPAAFRL